MSAAPGAFSPALLALRRWVRIFWKRVGIGLLSLVVLVNVSVSMPMGDMPVADIPVNADRMQGKLALTTAASVVQLSGSADISVDQRNARKSRSYSLDAHMTHYRLTRSRLSVPRPVQVSQRQEVTTAENRTVKVAEVR